MEKRIKVSTQGRVTIPKAMREALKIQDQQAIVIRSVEGKRELTIELMATINDFASV